MSTKIVAITGAAGQIGYSVLPMIASGQIYGPKVYIHLKLLDIQPAENSLKGILMELQDCAFPLLVKIEYGSDPYVIFKDADLIIFLGSFSRRAVQTRRELLQYNRKIFKDQGRAANKVCKETCKFLVVANPANTNCTILSLYASNIPKQNFSALTRLDQNRTVHKLAVKTNQDSQTIKGVIIWGNHSTTQYPDTNYVTINNIPIKNFFKDDKWLKTDLIQAVQYRGNKIIEIRKSSSALATANAIVGHCRDWIQGTKLGEWVNMAVISQGEYGIKKGIFYSFPVICVNENYQVKTDFRIDNFQWKMMKATESELIDEKAEALSYNFLLPSLACFTVIFFFTLFKN